jgi:hypothetical protein
MGERRNVSESGQPEWQINGRVDPMAARPHQAPERAGKSYQG